MAVLGEGKRSFRIGPVYSCSNCGVTRENPAGHHKIRAAMRCSLPGFDRAAWDPKAHREAAAEAERIAGELAASSGLDFNLDRDGCGQGWALCRFAQSIDRFKGQRTRDDPRRQPSYHMQRALQMPASPDRLIDAVEFLEAHEDGAFSIFQRMRESQQ